MHARHSCSVLGPASHQVCFHKSTRSSGHEPRYGGDSGRVCDGGRWVAACWRIDTASMRPVTGKVRSVTGCVGVREDIVAHKISSGIQTFSSLDQPCCPQKSVQLQLKKKTQHCKVRKMLYLYLLVNYLQVHFFPFKPISVGSLILASAMNLSEIWALIARHRWSQSNTGGNVGEANDHKGGKQKRKKPSHGDRWGNASGRGRRLRKEWLRTKNHSDHNRSAELKPCLFLVPKICRVNKWEEIKQQTKT